MIDHKEFWVQAWKEGRTRFHGLRPNADLVQYLPLYSSEKKVFVPLCGKSLDLLYLREHGKEVLGVEIANQALNEFFEENQLSYQKKKGPGNFTVWTTEEITLFEGDLFELTSDELAQVDLIYDRASLVALDPEQRTRYYRWLNCLKGPLSILLISFEYECSVSLGPPFSVPSTEIKLGLGHGFHIEELHRQVVEDLNPKFTEAGVTQFESVAYRLVKK
jgi:thiopurine S-methyltransferase